MKHIKPFTTGSVILWALAVLVALTIAACGGSGSSSSATAASSTSSSSSSSGSSSSGTSLAAGYKQAKWGSNMTVTYPSDCTMTVISDGLPNHKLAPYYLAPATGSYTTVAATTPDGLALTVQPNPDTQSPIALTYNIYPSKATATTATSMGTIGTMISGAALFNAFDATGDPAIAQNVSYSFTDASGQPQTASFIDTCNGHYTPAVAKSTYHYHGVSSCITAEVDTAGGPSHLIGIALDGYPVYGDRDMNGNVITVAQLDSCNGITSATPEFPNGVYHYVLPEGVSTAQSSMQCYAGTVSQNLVARAQAAGICISPLSTERRVLAFAMFTPALPKRRAGVPRSEWPMT